MDRRGFLRVAGVGALAGLVSTRGGFAEAADSPAGAGAAGDLFAQKVLIAHRGASAYAPENTLDAYKLAIKQGATLVEQDLNITKDGQLICIHDGSLEATTNVEEVYPDRFTESTVKGQKVKHWMVSDFTLAEIKKLKAGFRQGKGPATTTTEIPTWQEAIDTIRGKAGLCPETKSESYYKKLGFDMEKLVAEVLKKNGLDKRGADKSTPVLMQSFDKDSLGRLRAHGIDLPMLWLRFKGAKDLTALVKQAKDLGYVALGPFKDDITKDFVDAAHAAGLKVIPYTYATDAVAKGFADVKEEMANHLYKIGIDGLFTNNPDLFPRQAKG